ncbi:MAG: hypothetical protein UW20_C0014G0016 [Candidatus Woesebacteria bacterium GW2011_GWB1_44_11]|uniref:Uncharacterized protein n=1 Tax=Candidatus Woesebacteria bacterium GW2011_GWB1_44_11 TaxID=1618579 RepID=A0A837I5A9_9BACT|nr:MAG: hypothetical protein UW20_C0014G0016 [Candidatus Woesebacteria bacterium GW2011_GWB1_44_11]
MGKRDTIRKLWEILIEMVTGAADTAAVLTAAEAGVVLADEAGGLLSVRIEADARCLKQFAATAKKSARFLLDPQTAQGGPDLGAINAKLDKILNILEPKVATPVIPAPVVKEEKIADKVDLSKIKKAVKKAVKKTASTKKK